MGGLWSSPLSSPRRIKLSFHNNILAGKVLSASDGFKKDPPEGAGNFPCVYLGIAIGLAVMAHLAAWLGHRAIAPGQDYLLHSASGRDLSPLWVSQCLRAILGCHLFSQGIFALWVYLKMTGYPTFAGLPVPAAWRFGLLAFLVACPCLYVYAMGLLVWVVSTLRHFVDASTYLPDGSLLHGQGVFRRSLAALIFYALAGLMAVLIYTAKP